MSFTVLIPARMASSRLPDKPLADIGGLPMVVRVAQRVAKVGADQVVVATDHTRIADACREHGVPALMTRADHLSGSDRLAEACHALNLGDQDIVVNVQGDEPLIDPALVRACADLLLQRPDCAVATAAHPIGSAEELNNPNVVKVVLDAQQRALYFSRAAIPWWRDGSQAGVAQLPPQHAALRHIGLYAYRVGTLKRFPTWPAAPLELTESLEQLRFMWQGERVAVHVTDTAPAAGVDTPEDLARVRAVFAAA
ncbi:3-deoxy-manno-octulosonate cytidylyltransferase [Ideonella paludis]|uniref:3-deoxy-manno-octulosonate cytidylyltransferase n=1 Tax=Ideonella paludis TaxID=1233411 RepID=A0ABS5DUI1_9BURK|nr:3-deoxy-manno-octulosonate cytidylyltransferase [Ideonella paludis]MBQ0934805.1 3-deoxy-manno-octulosonate cytidylyltransferase [Ideonella paludis]